MLYDAQSLGFWMEHSYKILVKLSFNTEEKFPKDVRLSGLKVDMNLLRPKMDWMIESTNLINTKNMCGALAKVFGQHLFDSRLMQVETVGVKMTAKESSAPGQVVDFHPSLNIDRGAVFHHMSTQGCAPTSNSLAVSHHIVIIQPLTIRAIPKNHFLRKRYARASQFMPQGFR